MQIAVLILGFVGQRISSLGCTLKLRLALKVEQDSRFFYLAVFEYALNNFIAMKWFTGFFENFSDDICYRTAAVAP